MALSEPNVSDAMGGGFANPPRDAAIAFRAALDVMARPGVIREISGGHPPLPLSPAAGSLLLVLCDPETRVYLSPSCDTDAIRAWLRFHTGAPLVAADEADFAIGPWDELCLDLARMRQGVQDYPDRSVTLIVEMDHLAAEGVRLTGPGIQAEAYLNLPETAAFVANARRFPLGFDTFFTSGSQIAALPRSTRIEGAS